MNLSFLPIVISGIGSFVLGLFVLSKDKKNSINRVFFLFCVAILGWSFNTLGLIIAPNKNFVVFWTRVFGAWVILIPATFLHFVLVFIEEKTEKKGKLLYGIYGISLIFIIFNWTGYFIEDFIEIGNQYFPRSGLVYQIYTFNFIITTGYGLFRMFKKQREVTLSFERNQIKYLLIASLFAIIMGSLIFLPSFGIGIYPIWNLAGIVFTGIVAYAIVKYQLMDIRVVISRSITYASLVGAITGIYILTVGIFQGIFGATVFAQSSFLVNAIAAVIIAASFQPLKDKIRFTVDKLFFKEKYNPQKIIKEFTWALGSFIEKDKISHLLISTATETLHLAKSSVLLVEKETGRFRINATEGLPEEIAEKIHFEKDEFLPQWLKEKEKVFIREEFEFRLSQQEFVTTPGITQTLNKLKELEISLSIPLKIKNELVGIFNLDNKISEEMFTSEDLEFLTTLANQSVIALENARLYEEMRALEKNLHRSDKLSALGTLAANIAHEVKNPLVAIKTFTQLFPKKFNDPEFREKYNQIVPQELERLENILHELLNFSRPSKNTVQPIEIKNIIDEILLFMDSEILKNKVKVTKKYQDNLPRILANLDQMKQVFVNLILNALQAMPEGGILTITTFILNGRTDKRLSIEFSDTGSGVAEGDLKNLFKPFFSTKEDGTGLGLAIVKQIIKEHNGTIEVASKPNQGTTFLINLPF